jgi:hypothetical protein
MEMAMKKRNRDDEARQLMMHADVLEEIGPQYEAIQKEMTAYIAETELTPMSERTDAWKKEKEKRLEAYWDRMGAVTDRWNALDAAVEQLWGPRGIQH